MSIMGGPWFQAGWLIRIESRVLKGVAMNDRTSTGQDPKGGNARVTSHESLAGIDDKTIDAGATGGAQLPPKKSSMTKPEPVNRETAERGVAPDPDPDDPVSP